MKGVEVGGDDGGGKKWSKPPQTSQDQEQETQHPAAEPAQEPSYKAKTGEQKAEASIVQVQYMYLADVSSRRMMQGDLVGGW